MKTYYVRGEQVTAQEAAEIEKRNNKYLASNDFSLWQKIEFVVVKNIQEDRIYSSNI